MNKTLEGLLKFFKGMLVVPTLIVCDQHGCKRENYRTLVNARVVSISPGDEFVLGKYVLEADDVI